MCLFYHFSLEENDKSIKLYSGHEEASQDTFGKNFINPVTFLNGPHTFEGSLLIISIR